MKRWLCNGFGNKWYVMNGWCNKWIHDWCMADGLHGPNSVWVLYRFNGPGCGWWYEGNVSAIIHSVAKWTTTDVCGRLVGMWVAVLPTETSPRVWWTWLKCGNFTRCANGWWNGQNGGGFDVSIGVAGKCRRRLMRHAFRDVCYLLRSLQPLPTAKNISLLLPLLRVGTSWSADHLDLYLWVTLIILAWPRSVGILVHSNNTSTHEYTHITEKQQYSTLEKL